MKRSISGAAIHHVRNRGRIPVRAGLSAWDGKLERISYWASSHGAVVWQDGTAPVSNEATAAVDASDLFRFSAPRDGEFWQHSAGEIAALVAARSLSPLFSRGNGGEVRVTLADGTHHRHREALNRGSAEIPLLNADVRDKFMDNATLHFSPAHARAVCDLVLSLDQLKSASVLEDLLARDPDDVPGESGCKPR